MANPRTGSKHEKRSSISISSRPVDLNEIKRVIDLFEDNESKGVPA
jgi:hypothetical protein